MDTVVRPWASARNHGVIFDNALSFKLFCHKSASAAEFHVRSLSKSATTSSVVSLVTYA